MAITARQIADNVLIVSLIKQQSAALLQAYSANPRMSSVFATQQRWLLAHAAMGLVFRSAANGRPMMTLSAFLAKVSEHSVSSRNTADAFIKEMIHYGYVELFHSPTDRRLRLMAISAAALEAIYGWSLAHLRTLDQLDGGRRVQTFLATEGAVVRLEPEIADGLLTTPAIRKPQDTFSLFTWLNNGGVVMDRLITGLGKISDDGLRYPTSVGSITELAEWIKLSRTHLARKLREAETMGSLGWNGNRGDSAMWVSAGFVGEIMMAHAVKLAVIDAAFERCFGRRS